MAADESDVRRSRATLMLDPGLVRVALTHPRARLLAVLEFLPKPLSKEQEVEGIQFE